MLDLTSRRSLESVKRWKADLDSKGQDVKLYRAVLMSAKNQYYSSITRTLKNLRNMSVVNRIQI